MQNFLIPTLLLAGCLSASANATFISGNKYLSNGSKVALQNLEWMPLTYTAGLTRVDIEDGFTDRFGNTWGADEWRYATKDETETLILSLWDKEFDGWSRGNAVGAWWFLDSFGALGYDTGFGNSRTNNSFNNSLLTGLDLTYFIYGYNEFAFDPSEVFFGQVMGMKNYNSGQYARSVISGDLEISYYENSGATGYFYSGEGLNYDGYAVPWITYDWRSNPEYGHLLVRAAQNPPKNSVETPATFMLFTFGIFCLIFRDRNKYKYKD